jgi:hypothetical protein
MSTRRAGPGVGATDAGWKRWVTVGVMMRLLWRLEKARFERSEEKGGSACMAMASVLGAKLSVSKSAGA